MSRTLFQTASVQQPDIDAEFLALFFGSKGVPTALHPPIVAVGSRGETESASVVFLISSQAEPCELVIRSKRKRYSWDGILKEPRHAE
jgi:hypothetical protein